MVKAQFDRLVTGIKWFDTWLDTLLDKIEARTTITASPPLRAFTGPMGTHISMAGAGPFAWAKSKSGGINAGSSADVTLQDWSGSAMTSQVVDVKAINMGSTSVGATKLILLALVGKDWFVIWEDCPV